MVDLGVEIGGVKFKNPIVLDPRHRLWMLFE